MSGCHEKISRDNQPSTQTLVVAMLCRGALRLLSLGTNPAARRAVPPSHHSLARRETVMKP